MLMPLHLQEYQLTDHEGNLIVPCLVERAGHNQVRPYVLDYRVLPAAHPHLNLQQCKASQWMAMHSCNMQQVTNMCLRQHSCGATQQAGSALSAN